VLCGLLRVCRDVLLGWALRWRVGKMSDGVPMDLSVCNFDLQCVTRRFFSPEMAYTWPLGLFFFYSDKRYQWDSVG
jgi:hypothetical protein